MDEKRTVKVSLGVHWIEAKTGWNRSALLIVDDSGDKARREITLAIATPNELSYIRERLKDIEDAWRKELDAIKGE